MIKRKWNKEGKGVSTRSYLKKEKQADSQEIVTGVFSFLNIYMKSHLNAFKCEHISHGIQYYVIYLFIPPTHIWKVWKRIALILNFPHPKQGQFALVSTLGVPCQPYCRQISLVGRWNHDSIWKHCIQLVALYWLPHWLPTGPARLTLASLPSPPVAVLVCLLPTCVICEGCWVFVVSLPFCPCGGYFICHLIPPTPLSSPLF